LLEVFDWLILPIAIRVIGVCWTLVVYQEWHPACLEHLHHERRARAWQARNNHDHGKKLLTIESRRLFVAHSALSKP